MLVVEPRKHNTLWLESAKWLQTFIIRSIDGDRMYAHQVLNTKRLFRIYYPSRNMCSNIVGNLISEGTHGSFKGRKRMLEVSERKKYMNDELQ